MLPYYCYFDTILAYYRLDFPAMNLASGNLPFWFCSFDHRCRTFHLSLEFQFASVLRILGHHNPSIQFGPSPWTTICQDLYVKNRINEQDWKGFYDLSIASTKTKYIKLNTKIQNIFCRLNENLTTFLYTLTGVTRNQNEIKKILF